MVPLEVDRSGIILFFMTAYGNNILSTALCVRQNQTELTH